MYLLNRKKDLISLFVENNRAHFFYLKREKHGYCLEGYKNFEAAQSGVFEYGVLNPLFFEDALYKFCDLYHLKKPYLSIGIVELIDGLSLHYNLIMSFLGLSYRIGILVDSKTAFRSIISPKIENHLVYKAINLWKEEYESEK